MQRKIKQHFDNVEKIKKLNEGHKDIQAQKKAIQIENRGLQSEIIEFAEENGIENLKLSNGYVLTFTTREKPRPLNEEIIRSGIIDQLTEYQKNNTKLETIGFDKFINGLLSSIDSKRKADVESITSIKISKPKRAAPKKNTKKKSTKKK